MKIKYTPQAAADLVEIFDYIDKRHPVGALQVKKAIYMATGLLELFPYLGVRTDRTGVRMLVIPRYPYLVFYTRNMAEKEVSILSIRHTSRQR